MTQGKKNQKKEDSEVKTFTVPFALRENQENLTIKTNTPSNPFKEKIINQILEERKIIEGNKKIIIKFSKKISNIINKIWSN